MKADLHVHTRYSYDSAASPEEMIEAALKKGINCLAICDHGQIKGSLKAIEYAKDKPVLIIPGIEIKSKQGDILGLNIKEIIPNKLSAKETIKRINDLGGLATIPHPFGWSCSFRGNLEKLISEMAGNLAIEVLNASIFSSGNKKALQVAKNYNLPFTCGSDAHFPDFIGKAYLEIPDENLSFKEAAASSLASDKASAFKEAAASFLAESCDSKARSEMRTKFSASASDKSSAFKEAISSSASIKDSAVKEVLEAIKNKNCPIHGSEADFFEKIVDHSKRNLVKIKNLI